MNDRDALPPLLTEQILVALGLPARPPPTLPGLTAVYGAWCRRVPFDNLHKLVSLRSGCAGPLPGDDPVNFFEAWLRDGTGGTCWAGAGAMHALLSVLDFHSMRVVATMLARPDAAANHGTVIVDVDGQRYLVDSAILHDAPLLVTQNERPWTTRWRPLHQLAGIDCRIDQLGVSKDRFSIAHESTRSRSPFNDQPYLRVNREDKVIGLAHGHRIEIDAHGTVTQQALSPAAAARFLTEEVGIRDTLAHYLFAQ